MKHVQVVWSTEALDDLETIYDFLAAKSRQAAQRIVENILFRINKLKPSLSQEPDGDIKN